MPRTISEKILSAKAGHLVHAGDVVVCDVDLVIGTDASMPMAIDYFDAMGGTAVFDAARIVCSLDHYAPPTTAATKAFHARVGAFAARYGIEVYGVGEGISHQIAVERGRIRPGDLIIGADSHTVTCGAINAFAVGVGSSDLAAAMLTGQIWLRVPQTIRVTLRGRCPAGVGAKDVALALVREIGADGADYQAIEFSGSGLDGFSIDDRLVLANLAVEMGAKAAIGPCDAALVEWRRAAGQAGGLPVQADQGADYVREIAIDLGAWSPRVALPHAPDRVVPLTDVPTTSVQMVFVGTCAGGRAGDIREVLAVIRLSGGTIAPGVQLVVTPASGAVERDLRADGTLAALEAMGASVTMAGCGACCGTSGVIPGDHATVVSTANRNFKARMGNATARIYLASPATCAMAAVTGRLGN